jgi:hypothetical protein
MNKITLLKGSVCGFKEVLTIRECVEGLVPELVEGEKMTALRAASSLCEVGGAGRGLRCIPFDKLRDQKIRLTL